MASHCVQQYRPDVALCEFPAEVVRGADGQPRGVLLELLARHLLGGAQDEDTAYYRLVGRREARCQVAQAGVPLLAVGGDPSRADAVKLCPQLRLGRQLLELVVGEDPVKCRFVEYSENRFPRRARVQRETVSDGTPTVLEMTEDIASIGVAAEEVEKHFQ